MKNINEYKLNNKKNIYASIKKNYMEALTDANFVKLVNRLDIEEDELIKYTTKLQSTTNELDHCKNCPGLNSCQNKICGYINYPVKEGKGLIFEYMPCKYEKDNMKQKTKANYFEMPEFLKEAKMSDIFMEKERLPIIKYLKEYISEFGTDDKLKALYLCGSFGSGKSYLLTALINEISKKGFKCNVVYYPSLLKTLKASFNTDDFDIKFDEIMTCDVVLLDDIGAENNTSWSRDEILGTILQYRMDNKLSTFFTSNLTLEELENHLKLTTTGSDSIKARRIIERIKQLSNQMELISENKRK